jgi:tellurite methyltransferase
MDDDRTKGNRRYASEEWFLGRNPSSYLVEQIDFITRLCPGREALDIACGEGRNSIFLARHGFRVTGVDISDTGLAKARRWAEKEEVPVNFIAADLESFSPDRSYDLIINFNFLLRGLIPRLVDTLSPGGVLVLDTILDTPALPAEHNKAFLLQPGELPELFRDFSGSIHAYRELPEDISPTAKLIFHKR